MQLSETQAGFARALIHGGPATGFLVGPAGLDADAALAIYRNNVFSNYRRALAASYPVVLRLIGEDCFHQAVDALVRAAPSTDGDVARYGTHFPAFLETYPPTAGLAYLPDVARLEWAIEEASTAPDAPPLDLTLFAAADPDTLRLALHPSARLLSCDYPVLAIWRANQPGAADEIVNLDAGGEHLLVLRRPDDVAIEALGRGEFAWLRALAAGLPLGAALELALEVEPDFDIAPILSVHALTGSLTNPPIHR